MHKTYSRLGLSLRPHWSTLSKAHSQLGSGIPHLSPRLLRFLDLEQNHFFNVPASMITHNFIYVHCIMHVSRNKSMELKRMEKNETAKALQQQSNILIELT